MSILSKSPFRYHNPSQLNAFLTRSYSAVSHNVSCETDTTSLHGTVTSHRAYILLHSHQPPSEFSARHSTPLQRALQLKASKWGGIVNFAWYGEQNSDDDKQRATMFSASGGRLDIPEISLENLDEVERILRNHAIEEQITEITSQEIHILICTHGARDCRCGNFGGQVVTALREDFRKRQGSELDSLASRVKVGEVGHVGGHQYAGNMLLFPYGEWLGLLRPEHVPMVLSTILQIPPRPYTVNDPPLFRSNWRGRTGLNKAEQIQLHHSSSP